MQDKKELKILYWVLSIELEFQVNIGKFKKSDRYNDI
jgi:hypothetical protein